MKIHVRRKHIEKGTPNTCQRCPIALAFQDATGYLTSIGTDCIRIDGENRPLPASAMRFIARFDAGKPVKPFAFVLK